MQEESAPASSLSSIYGFDESILPRAGSSTHGPWEPSADNASRSMVAGSTRNVGAADRSSASKGWFSCRVMILGPPKCVLCKPNHSGQQTTMVIATCVLIDHPGDKEGVKINDSQMARIEHDGFTLSVAIVEKGIKNDNGVQRNITLRFKEANRKILHRGSVFEFTVFGKEGFANKTADRPCDFGDIVRLNGITRELRPGKNIDPETNKPRLFPSINVKEAKHWLNVFDTDAEERIQTHVFSTCFNWMVETVPTLIPMVIPENVDYTKLLEEKRRKLEEKKAKNPQSVAQANAAVAKPPAQQDQKFLSKRQIQYPDENDEYQVEAEEPGLDEKKEAGDSALSFECRKFKWDNPDIFVPLHVVDPKIIQYMRMLGVPFTGYLCQPSDTFRIDPTAVDNYRREKRPGKDEPKPPEGAPKVYEPTFKFNKRVIQVKAGMKQEITFEVTLPAETLKWYGITDPERQKDVLPFLAAPTPAVARTWIRGVASAEKSDPSDPNRFTYVLIGTVKRGDPPVNQVGLIADVACGVVSAGYRVSASAACELLNILGKRPEYADPKNERMVSADMTNRRLINKYARGTDLNKINTIAQNAPVVNCCESTDNWLAYGHDYYFYIVSNWAEKNFIRFPALKEKIASFGPDPTEQFSKIFLQAAKEEYLPADLLEHFGPAYPIGGTRPTSLFKMEYVIFAIRKDYAEKRGLDKYHGDNAFADVICHCEDYLVNWMEKLKLKGPPAIVHHPPQKSPAPAAAKHAAPNAAATVVPGTNKRKHEDEPGSDARVIAGRLPPAVAAPAAPSSALATQEVEMKEAEEGEDEGGEDADEAEGEGEKGTAEGTDAEFS